MLRLASKTNKNHHGQRWMQDATTVRQRIVSGGACFGGSFALGEVRPGIKIAKTLQKKVNSYQLCWFVLLANQVDVVVACHLQNSYIT